MNNTPSTNSSEIAAEEKIQTNGLLDYSDDKYSFKYPDTWTKDSSNTSDTIVLKSKDYKKERLVEAQKPYHIISEGYLLTVSEISSNAPNETIEKLTAHIVEEEKTLGGGSHKEIKVDNYQALWVNNKHEDTYLYVIVFHDGKRTHIQLDAKDDSSADVMKQFDEILASFKFK